ncbi:MAG: GatB/YqeY domain-containing protein [Spirochaetales bacterium]
MIIDELKKANMDAMRNKDKTARTIYSIILNKASLAGIEKRVVGEELTDVDVIKIIQKTIKELSEEAENYEKVGNHEAYNDTLKQQAIINEYLPKMLSESEIKNIISKLEDKSMPSVMRHFKENYAGKCDMGAVNKVLRTL